MDSFNPFLTPSVRKSSSARFRRYTTVTLVLFVSNYLGFLFPFSRTNRFSLNLDFFTVLFRNDIICESHMFVITFHFFGTPFLHIVVSIYCFNSIQIESDTFLGLNVFCCRINLVFFTVVVFWSRSIACPYWFIFYFIVENSVHTLLSVIIFANTDIKVFPGTHTLIRTFTIRLICTFACHHFVVYIFNFMQKLSVFRLLAILFAADRSFWIFITGTCTMAHLFIRSFLYFLFKF
uniref:Uncharacterized protein n=1 Tax=Cacopsylla melanoneura TaxID=428564 RepID=A0A8D8ZFH5_9HEMI